MTWIDNATSDQVSDLSFDILQPGARLRPLVRFYWVLSCPQNAPVVDEYLAPDGFEEIIFSYGGAYTRKACGDNTNTQTLKGSYIVGGKDTGLLCTRATTLNMIGIKFWPQSLSLLLGIPFNSLLNKTLTLEDLQSPKLNALESRLFECEDISRIQQTLDATLETWLETENIDRMLNMAVSMIFNSAGNTSIDEITRRCGCHYRTLEKRFREKLGHSPKSLAKTVRFKNTFHAISTASSAKKFDLNQFGYYDQSHFSKEFKLFTGTSPGKFFSQHHPVSTQVFDASQLADLGS